MWHICYVAGLELISVEVLIRNVHVSAMVQCRRRTGLICSVARVRLIRLRWSTIKHVHVPVHDICPVHDIFA